MLNPLALLALLAAPAFAAPPSEAYRRIFVVILENTDYSLAMQQPYLARLAKEGASLANYHGVSHPSEPNYMGMIAGDTMGFFNDAIRTVEGRNLATLLTEHGQTWRAYNEDLPAPCSTVASNKGLYARKHNALISFKEIQSDKPLCEKGIVSSDRLDPDIAAGKLADFSLYIPNLNNDGHDTGVAVASQWLEKAFGPRLKNDKFMKGTLFIVTFDESGADLTNHIYTALYGSAVKPGASSDERYNHYSLLKLVEDRFGTGSLGRGDAGAAGITGVWAK